MYRFEHASHGMLLIFFISNLYKPAPYPAIFLGCQFFSKPSKEKNHCATGKSGKEEGGRCCKPSPVGSRCGTPEHFVYFVFWIAQNFALTALWQRTVAKAHTRNQNLWGFGGLSLGFQTGIPASKELWIQHCKLFLQRNKYIFSIYIYIYIFLYISVFSPKQLNYLSNSSANFFMKKW